MNPTCDSHGDPLRSKAPFVAEHGRDRTFEARVPVSGSSRLHLEALAEEAGASKEERGAAESSWTGASLQPTLSSSSSISISRSRRRRDQFQTFHAATPGESLSEGFSEVDPIPDVQEVSGQP